MFAHLSALVQPQCSWLSCNCDAQPSLGGYFSWACTVRCGRELSNSNWAVWTYSRAVLAELGGCAVVRCQHSWVFVQWHSACSSAVVSSSAMHAWCDMIIHILQYLCSHLNLQLSTTCNEGWGALQTLPAYTAGCREQ